MRRLALLCLLLGVFLAGDAFAQTYPPRPVFTKIHDAVATATANGTVLQTGGYGMVAVQWTSTSSWDGTLTFEISVDGTNYGGVICRSALLAATYALTATATSGTFFCPVLGTQKFRARVSGRTVGTMTAWAGQVEPSLGY
jgi:hypothetical protein